MLLIVVVSVPASAGKLGIIGDSLSTAMSANDQCDDTNQCLLQIREDRTFSFAGGVQPWSLRSRLAVSAGVNIDGVVDQSRNGARWDDAFGQAQRLLNDSDLSHVSIELGGNDVCRDLGEALPDLNEISGHIDSTLGLLSESLDSGASILLAEVPNVVQIYQQVRDRENFLFANCQALWDLDSNRISDNLVQSLCDQVLPGGCNNFLQLVVARPLVAALFEQTFVNGFGSEFPCGKVLNSASSDAERTDARAFNLALNDLLAAKANQFNGRNGVQVRFAAGVFEQNFQSQHISALDCFHPSRSGQQLLADTIWNDLGLDRVGESLPFSDDFETR